MADISTMLFAKVFPLLINKVERKGRTKEEALEVTCWLTGYTTEQLISMETSTVTYGEFINQAPCWNPKSIGIKGSICGIRIENIEDPFMKKVRILDKLIDDLAKGKAVEKLIGKV